MASRQQPKNTSKTKTHKPDVTPKAETAASSAVSDDKAIADKAADDVRGSLPKQNEASSSANNPYLMLVYMVLSAIAGGAIVIIFLMVSGLGVGRSNHVALNQQIDELSSRLEAASEQTEVLITDNLQTMIAETVNPLSNRVDHLETIIDGSLNQSVNTTEQAKVQNQKINAIIRSTQALGQDIETLKVLSDRHKARIDDPLTRQRIGLALLQLAVNEGRPFINEYQLLREAGDDSEALSVLEGYAKTGVASQAVLDGLLASRIDAMIDASNLPENATIWDRLYAMFRSSIRIRPIGLVEGTTPPERLARIEYYQALGDLDKTLNEFENLPDHVAKVGHDWFEAARKRRKVLQAVHAVGTHFEQDSAL